MAPKYPVFVVGGGQSPRPMGHAVGGGVYAFREHGGLTLLAYFPEGASEAAFVVELSPQEWADLVFACPVTTRPTALQVKGNEVAEARALVEHLSDKHSFIGAALMEAEQEMERRMEADAAAEREAVLSALAAREQVVNGESTVPGGIEEDAPASPVPVDLTDSDPIPQGDGDASDPEAVSPAP